MRRTRDDSEIFEYSTHKVCVNVNVKHVREGRKEVRGRKSSRVLVES
jgi:hypothetical protein